MAGGRRERERGVERGMWRTEIRGEEREGRTQPAEERSEEEEEEGGPWGL